jgi:uncharacterized membrane protein YhfC
MVSSSTITALLIATVVCFLFPPVFAVWFKIKHKISLKPVFLGVAVFILFVLILEQMMHVFVLRNGLITNPVIFAIYGALAAGVFEEGGRFIAYTTLLKDKGEWKDGIAYGIGHGGIETIIIGGFSYLSNLTYSNLINSGMFESVFGTDLPEDQLAQINELKQALLELSGTTVMIGTLERVFAFGLQLALSLIVLYAVRKQRYIYVLAAVLIHALIDFPAVLFQMGILNLYTVESMAFVVFIASVIFIVKSKKLFNDSELRGTEI